MHRGDDGAGNFSVTMQRGAVFEGRAVAHNAGQLCHIEHFRTDHQLWFFSLDCGRA